MCAEDSKPARKQNAQGGPHGMDRTWKRPQCPQKVTINWNGRPPASSMAQLIPHHGHGPLQASFFSDFMILRGIARNGDTKRAT